MAKFTTQVRSICEAEAGKTKQVGFNEVDNVLTIAAPKVFNFDFPIFDEEYRLPLEKKILMHYYTREIGEETVGLWKLRLAARLNEIMPYYNQLYKSQLLTFNPMYDVDYSTTRTTTTTGSVTGNENSTRDHKNETLQNQKSKATTTDDNVVTNDNTTTTTVNQEYGSEETSKTTGKELDLYSDTPQGSLTGVETENYLTNARKKTNENNTTDNSSGTMQDNTTETDKGTTSTTGSTVTDKSGDVTTESSSSDKTTTDNTKQSNNLEEYIEHVAGKMSTKVSMSALMLEFRKTFLRIDAELIGELQDLFFGLWE